LLEEARRRTISTGKRKKERNIENERS